MSNDRVVVVFFEHIASMYKSIACSYSTTCFFLNHSVLTAVHWGHYSLYWDLLLTHMKRTGG